MEPCAHERRRLHSARGVIVVSGANRIVKALSLMVLLGGNTGSAVRTTSPSFTGSSLVR